VTLLAGEGGYTGQQRVVLFTVVSRREVATVRKIVSQADPQAFMVINPSHEVLGEGFKPLLHPRPPYRVRPRGRGHEWSTSGPPDKPGTHLPGPGTPPT